MTEFPDHHPAATRALVCHQWGEIEDLRLEEVTARALTSGQVRIAVHAAGVNFADLLIARGKYQVKPPFPFSPGMEAAGVVTEVAAGVTGVQPGQHVLAFLDHGGYAEEVVARAHETTVLPASMDFVTAAAMPVAYATSHLALSMRARLQPGEVLLVHGASGGVGLTAVEIGHALGATVIASASSAERLAVAKERGADHLIDYSREDIRDRVMELTGGADVVYDPVGGDAFTASLRCIRPGGRMLVIGFASGTIPQIPANLLLVKDAAALGFSLGQVREHRPDAVQAAMHELLAWYSEGRLSPHVSSVVPFEEFGEAMRLLRDRRSTGKVVLQMRDDAGTSSGATP
ncbi:MAG: NADPH:quinone oxidoreductase family protein [Chloroflexi bacterium]|nr:NADPH:quinone oxidoreductase family protein [Chloroflexota bacterium]